MELLFQAIPHHIAHDLELLLYVLLFICTHLQGPYNSVRDPPLYEKGQPHPSPMKEWFYSTNPLRLRDLKFSHMIGHFESDNLPNMSPYFKPLKLYISALWNILLLQRLTMPSVGLRATHSSATCCDVISIFKSVLEDKSLIEEAKQSSAILGKYSHPRDLISAKNG